jgi:hypothetical protein
MSFGFLAGQLSKSTAVWIWMLAASATLLAQGPLPEAPSAPVESATPIVVKASSEERPHRFFDKRNLALFAAAASLNMTDFAATRANLQSGGKELNPMVRMFGRSTPGLAFNFAGETAGMIGVSYFLHRTGHHKLERIVPMVSIGSSGVAVSYSLSHR